MPPFLGRFALHGSPDIGPAARRRGRVVRTRSAQGPSMCAQRQTVSEEVNQPRVSEEANRRRVTDPWIYQDDLTSIRHALKRGAVLIVVPDKATALRELKRIAKIVQRSTQSRSSNCSNNPPFVVVLRCALSKWSTRQTRLANGRLGCKAKGATGDGAGGGGGETAARVGCDSNNHDHHNHDNGDEEEEGDCNDDEADDDDNDGGGGGGGGGGGDDDDEEEDDESGSTGGSDDDSDTGEGSGDGNDDSDGDGTGGRGVPAVAPLRKRRSRKYTYSFKAYECDARVALRAQPLESSVLAAAEAEARRVQLQRELACSLCGNRFSTKQALGGHRRHCGGAGAGMTVCKTCLKPVKATALPHHLCALPAAAAPPSELRWCVVVDDVWDCHTDHDLPFTRRTVTVAKEIMKAYQEAVGGAPSAATRRRALDAAMSAAPGAALSMRDAYNMEAAIREAAGANPAGSEDNTDVMAAFVATLLLSCDTSFVVLGHNSTEAPFSIVRKGGDPHFGFFASHDFGEEHEILFGSSSSSSSASSSSSSGGGAAAGHVVLYDDGDNNNNNTDDDYGVNNTNDDVWRGVASSSSSFSSSSSSSS